MILVWRVMEDKGGIALFLLLFSLASPEPSCSVNTKAIQRRLLENSDYDPSVRPLADTGQPVNVNVDITIYEIGPINGAFMELGVGILLRQQWQDPRLRFWEQESHLVMSHLMRTSIWLPDVFFPQEKRGDVHALTVPNVLLHVYPNGSVLYSQRLSLTVRCPMDFKKFPMDQQTCRLEIESYAYTKSQMTLSWSRSRRSTDVEASIPDFVLLNISEGVTDKVHATGVFPRIYVDLVLRREVGFYMTQTYMPSLLVVVLSWASFWIDHDAIPARISVGLLTVLTITTQASGARTDLPRVPYIKAIDVWLAVCLFFVFAAYMEFAVVTVLSRHHRKGVAQSSWSQNFPMTRSLSKLIPDTISLASSRQSVSGPAGSLTSRTDSPSRDPGRRVEKVSRVIFPLFFGIFNMVYWLYYCLP